MENPVFDTVAEALGRDTDLEELEARGTLRLALKQSGLEARSVTAPQMRAVLSQVLPAELRIRDIDAPESVCERIAKLLDEDPMSGQQENESPEAIFRRLARS